MPTFFYKENRIFYRQQGQGSLMVICPGNTASSICHQADMEYFTQDFTVAVIDYLGTGQSDRLPNFGEDWFESCADQVAALIEHLGLGPAILLGTSGGAVVAMQAAARHPDSVRAVIADSFTPVFTEEMLHNNVIEERALRSEGQVGFWRFAQGEDWEAVVAADTAMLTKLTARGGDWLGDSLSRVTCPVFLTASLEDRTLVHPETYVNEMLARLQHGRAYINQHGGHPLMWSDPDSFRKAVKGFLNSFLE
jgi:pimeloyl-ACP methyl ester carboxylesterase